MNRLYKPLSKGILIILISFVSSQIFAQTFTNSTPTTITDNSTTSVPILVSGLGSSIDTTTFGLESVTLKINHSSNSELTIWLQSPDGKMVLLAKGLTGSNFNNSTFNGTAARYVDFGTAPYSNSFRSIQDLAYLNNFQNPNGTWNLVVKDGQAGRVGSVQSVSVKFSNQPAKPILSSSNLPIIIINTNGNEIVDDPKITADMNIIYNGPGAFNYANQTTYNYSGKIGIEFRGHSSQQFPKKQYGFETLNAAGDDDIDVSLLGMPAESDWILSANYSDKSMMRNVLTYQLSREMGNYASRTQYCEVIVNNEYKGVFVLMEKIKRNQNRVDVEKLKSTDIAEPNVTGGYIFAIDKIDPDDIWWPSQITTPQINFIFTYPKKAADLAPEQKTYLQNYVNSFEQALKGANYQDPITGFRQYADDISFMDFFILNELSKNVDGYRISSYFHKKRLGKIVAGPVWDFDIAWGNADYYDGNMTNGFQYLYSLPSNDGNKVPFWWSRLMSDGVWKSQLYCRYGNFRNSTLSQARMFTIIDSLATELQSAQARNFTRWDILGKYVWPNPSPIPANYSGEITKLKNWITARLTFLDASLGPCIVTPVTLTDFSGSHTNGINTLKWSVANEKPNDKFIIERSSDSQTFTSIGTVAGTGEANSIQHYSFNDIHPEPGINFYRLKMTGMDGNINYSRTISLGTRAGKWSLQPTIAERELTILSPVNGNQKLQLNVFDISGQRVSSASMMNNSVMKYNVSGLPAGNYILTISNNSGIQVTLRFIRK